MSTTAQPMREVVIHESANRPNQLLGGDRELVVVALLLAGSLAFALATWWGIVVSTTMWATSVAVLKRMGKADPQLRQVYLRHITYRSFYPAKSGLYSLCVPTPTRWT